MEATRVTESTHVLITYRLGEEFPLEGNEIPTGLAYIFTACSAWLKPDKAFYAKAGLLILNYEDDLREIEELEGTLEYWES